MKLKEKFIVVTGNYNNEELVLESIKIADEFAIGFAEWFTNEKSEYSIMYGNQEKRFATFTKEYTAKELLEIYKNEKHLCD
jgi:hypothetical protein